MTGLTDTDGMPTAQFLFPEEFIGFQGHFPGQKVLPGVCQIHCVLAVIEQGAGVPVVLREVLLAKYAAPVLPGETLTCVVQRVATADGDAVFKARLDTHGKKVAEIKLRVAMPAETV
jgi:3-hydroxyacyl-[acyl-carrier-protein] dehydratase